MAIADLVFNGLFAGDIGLTGYPVLVQLAVLLRIVKRILVNRGLADFFFPLDKVIGAGLNGISTVRDKEHDGRFSYKNKDWARTIPVFEDADRIQARFGLCSGSCWGCSVPVRPGICTRCSPPPL